MRATLKKNLDFLRVNFLKKYFGRKKEIISKKLTYISPE